MRRREFLSSAMLPIAIPSVVGKLPKPPKSQEVSETNVTFSWYAAAPMRCEIMSFEIEDIPVCQFRLLDHPPADFYLPLREVREISIRQPGKILHLLKVKRLRYVDKQRHVIAAVPSRFEYRLIDPWSHQATA